MRMNMAQWDRIARMLLGMALFSWAVAGGPWWAYFGLVFLAMAAWRFCPIYAVFRIGTFKR